jgi:alpha-1,3-mannosyltransferase
VVFSCAFAMKMNIIFFAPALFVLLVVEVGAIGAAWRIAMCGALQLALGWPFLMHDAKAYIGASFNVGRVFKHKWSVNFRWVPCTPLPPEEELLLEDCTGLFTSKGFGLACFASMALLMLLFAHARWCRAGGGLWQTLWARQGRPAPGYFSDDQVVTMLFCSNFLGVICSRSLHFQFYMWYYHTLPWLTWCTRLPLPLRLALLAAIELCWNPWSGDSSSPTSAVRRYDACLMMRRARHILATAPQ